MSNFVNELLLCGSVALLVFFIVMLVLVGNGKDPLTRHLRKRAEREKLERWQRYTAGGQGPEAPVDRYLVFAPTKTGLDSGAIRFECPLYRWLDALQCGDRHNRYYGDWSLDYNPDLQRREGGLGEQIWPAATPIEQLAEAWADYCRQARQLNEQLRDRHIRHEQERQEKASRRALEQAQKQSLLDSARQTAALLPDLAAADAQVFLPQRRR